MSTIDEVLWGALAAKRIDADNAEEMSVWCKELAISEQRLREVIQMIGPMTAAVRFYVASPKFKVAHAVADHGDSSATMSF